MKKHCPGNISEGVWLILLKESQCDKISSWIFYLIWDYYGLYCLILL